MNDQAQQQDLLLAYYGDDFTGSADVMEALTTAGVPAALFLEPPTQARLLRFPGVRAVGVAGVARSLPAAQMDAELAPVFRGLSRLGAPLLHYKMCSTADSSPEIGSIGRAIELGRNSTGSAWVPLLVGVPQLSRYTVFGNLFARSGPESEIFRLDRHPTMRTHPITPMDEADLVQHFGKQTGLKIACLDILGLRSGDPGAALMRLLCDESPEIVLFDVLEERDLDTIGQLLWDMRRNDGVRFIVGSSGIEYALVSHWRTIGILEAPPIVPKAAEVEQIIAVSGSCSPVTARQIEHAVSVGFTEIPVDTAALLDPVGAATEMGRVINSACAAIINGLSVIIHTSRGPDDPRIAQFARARVKQDRVCGGSELLGGALGVILGRIQERSALPRLCISGGDTSGYAAKALGVQALTVVAAFSKAMPFCRAHSDVPWLDGVQMIFKGGQTGKIDFFDAVRRGRP